MKKEKWTMTLVGAVVFSALVSASAAPKASDLQEALAVLTSEVTEMRKLLMAQQAALLDLQREVLSLRKEVESLKQSVAVPAPALAPPARSASPSAPTAPAPTSPSPPATSSASVDDDPALGDPKAPVTIIEFSDYQCPVCARFYRDYLPALKERYIATGKVRFVYRDFPLSSHPMAQKTAEATQCAFEQGKFWEYHDLVFERQRALSLDNLKAWAGELGLAASPFAECLDTGKYTAEVQKDYQDGLKAGVGGTPSFIIGRATPEGLISGKFLRGLRSPELFIQEVDALLLK
jgi:protein-disulfide isomerase